MGGRGPRSRAAILAEIRDIERYLAEVPPHSASSEDLRDRLDRLRAELLRAGRGDPPSGPGPSS